MIEGPFDVERVQSSESFWAFVNHFLATHFPGPCRWAVEIDCAQGLVQWQQRAQP